MGGCLCKTEKYKKSLAPGNMHLTHYKVQWTLHGDLLSKNVITGALFETIKALPTCAVHR